MDDWVLYLTGKELSINAHQSTPPKKVCHNATVHIDIKKEEKKEKKTKKTQPKKPPSHNQ